MAPNESIRGLRALPSAGPGDNVVPIPETELGYPVESDPWAVVGHQDPSMLDAVREVPLEELHRMTRTDGHARALLNVLTWPIRAAGRSVIPFEGGEKEADFIRDMLELPPHRGGMSTRMSYVLECHCLAFRDAFALFNKVSHVGDDGFIRLRKLSPRPARTLTLRQDEHGGFDGAVQKVFYQGRQHEVIIPREASLLFTVGKAESPLYGESLFLPAYYHYDKKHRLYYTLHVAAQAAAVPLRVGKVPSGTNRRALEGFRQHLQALGLQGSLAIPDTYEVETHTGSQGVLDAILKVVEHHDVAMSKSILAHFLDVGTEGKGNLGTATTTSELGDLFVVALEAHLQDIADGFNSFVIPYYVDSNFGTGKYPTFQFEPFSDDQKAVITETFGKLFSPTSPPQPEFVFELQRRMASELGLDEIDWNVLKERAVAEQALRDEVKAETAKAQLEGLKAPAGAPPVPGGATPPNATPPGMAPGAQPAVAAGRARLVGLSDGGGFDERAFVAALADEARDRAIALSNPDAPRDIHGSLIYENEEVALASNPTEVYVVVATVGSTVVCSPSGGGSDVHHQADQLIKLDG